MDEKLDEILNVLKTVESRLDNIENHLKNVNNDCSKMNQHIEFVEKTYNSARAPLNYIKNKIEYIMHGSSSSELPKLEYKEPPKDSSNEK
jgi:archaellum component FlaC